MVLEKNKRCQIERQKEVAVARRWYQVTDGTSPRGTKFPLNAVPWLNQTITNILGYYSFNDFEANWLAGFGTWQEMIEKIDAGISAHFKNAPFESSEEFRAVTNAFNKAIKVNIFSSL